ncbi:MAG: hypothetical protein IKK62_05855 [Bacteroidaceae bacterium]|nr:hypothetical protein [Bacteroidaceae bacterium]
MAQEVTNFARFYASFNQLPYSGDRESFKREIVRQYTWGRTESLKEMTIAEYNACCEGLEKLTGRKEEQKKKRSKCLKLMQELGIDTTDWTRINYFCQDQRIAGKLFARLKNEELDALAVKLRSIQRKGGLKQKKEVKPTGEITYLIPIGESTPKC